MLNAVITSKDKSGNTMQYPIETFDRPLDWVSFRGYPLTFQRLYIEKLKEKYNVTQAKLAEMFGIHFSTFSRYCTDHLNIAFTGQRMSQAEVEAFQAFHSKLDDQKKRISYEGENGYDSNHMNQIRVVEESTSPQKDKESNSAQRKKYQDIPIVIGDDEKCLAQNQSLSSRKDEDRAKRSTLKDLYLNFDGELNVTDIFWTVKKLVPDGTAGSMVIKCVFK